MLFLCMTMIDSVEDKSKFEKLYIKYRQLMKYEANKILKDDYLAEDAVHSSFLKIAKHIGSVEKIDSHKTASFVVIIVRRTSLDILRKEKGHQSVSIDDYKERRAVEYYDDYRFSVDELVDKIEKMPEQYREILSLKCSGDLTDKEIADILGISHQAERKRLERARSFLCKKL